MPLDVDALRSLRNLPSESAILNTKSLREDEDTGIDISLASKISQLSDISAEAVPRQPLGPRSVDYGSAIQTEQALEQFGAQPTWEHEGGYLRDWRTMYSDIWKEDEERWSAPTDIAGKVVVSALQTGLQGLGTIFGLGTSIPSGIWEAKKYGDWRFLARNIFNGRGWGDIYLDRISRGGHFDFFGAYVRRSHSR